MYKELKTFDCNTDCSSFFSEGETAKCRIILKHGMCIDPENKVEELLDIAIRGDRIAETGENLVPEIGDIVIDCKDLLVVPGLIDLHLHLGDLFEQSTRSIECAVEDGVTLGISPGAGNTFMAPALLGAEIDRGLPINIGVMLGAAAVLGTMLSTEELIKLFAGTLNPAVANSRLSRNAVTNATAQYVIGIKDHMGHFILSDENLEKIYRITSESGLLFASHTQDPEHAKRVFSLAADRPLHLAHANAAGAGTHGDGLHAMRDVIALVDGETTTAEFVTTMLRKSGGSREGLRMTERARMEALEALEAGIIRILVSDGQNQSTMKGFGDTRDNIPALLELVDEKILSLPDAVATMTCNPAALLKKRTGNAWWGSVGNLTVGSMANVTVINAGSKMASYTITNGKITAFENRIIRAGYSAGYWVSKYEPLRMGVGNLGFVERVRSS